MSAPRTTTSEPGLSSIRATARRFCPPRSWRTCTKDCSTRSRLKNSESCIRRRVSRDGGSSCWRSRLGRIAMASEQDDVLILGGGFAGLSAAVALASKGKKVLVLEKKPHLGGRAYSFEEGGLDVDNGQHLFMGCYRATRRFLKAIGTESRLDIYHDIVVDYAEPGGKKDRLACPSWLPAPLHLAAGLLGLKGVPLKDKSALIAFDESLKAMKKGEIPAAVEKLTVRQWLTSLGLSPLFQTRFFDPAAIGILNDKPEVASAAGFVQALREMFFTGRESSRFALAKTGLSALYTDAARSYIEARGGRVISTA